MTRKVRCGSKSIKLSIPPFGLGKCQPVLTQTQQSNEPDMVCYKISPFGSITCSQVGPVSSSGQWLQQEDSTNLVFRCRKKMQMENILKTLILLFHICVGDAMLCNHHEYSETN